MLDHTDAEKLKKAKEIADIESDRKKLQYLLNSGNKEELGAFLGELSGKYFSETICWNAVHPIPGRDVLENAQNCIVFLNSLAATKVIEKLK